MKILKKLNNKKIEFTLQKKKIFAADFETIIIKNKHYVFAIGLKYIDKNEKEQYKYWYMTNQIKNEKDAIESSYDILTNFLKWLIENFKNNTYYIYFHNLRSFDGFFIINIINLKFENYKYDLIIKNAMIYKIKFNNIIFLDSLNIINDTLDNIATLFINKRKSDWNWNNVNNYEEIFKNKNQIEIYLRNDTELLFEIVHVLYVRFITLFNISITKNITISSISFSLYRKKYLKKEYNIENCNEFKYNFISKAFFGGLCNLHYTKSEHGYVFDVNSLYPYIMKEKDFPCGKAKWKKIDEKNRLKIDIQKIFGYVKCLIFIPENILVPPLLTRDQEKGHTLQPTGYLKGIWFSEEIKNAIRLGCKILKIYEFIDYKENKNLFKDFVNDLYEKRIESNDHVNKLLYKNIMNSLYGRFGIKREKNITLWGKHSNVYENISKNNSYYGENNEICVLKVDSHLYKEYITNPNICKEDKSKVEKIWRQHKIRSKNSFYGIHIAAAISAYARIKLINDITDHIVKENAIVYYYDTDSIFTNKKLNDAIISKHELGKYKYDVFEKAVFVSPKTYCLVLKNKDSKKEKENKCAYREKNERENIEEISRIIFKTMKKKQKTFLSYDTMVEFLNKGKVLHIDNIDIPIYKNFRKLEIMSAIRQLNFNFESNKYIKLYDKNNTFYRTKPIHFDISYLKNIKEEIKDTKKSK